MDKGASYYLRYLQGDDTALADIINEYCDGLIIYLNSITGNYGDAEECAEDCFVKLAVKKPKYTGKASFKTWLYAIGRNKAIDMLRKKHRSGVTANEKELGVTESLEEQYIHDENKRMLYKAMAKLSPEHRQALWLTYFENMTAKEAAKVMGKSQKATESLIYRARSSLKNQLEKDGFKYENT